MSSSDVITISNRVWIPDALLTSIGEWELSRLKQRTVVTPKKTRFAPNPDPVRCYVRGSGKVTGLPHYEGLKLISKHGWSDTCEVRDERVLVPHGHTFTKYPDPFHPKAPEGQEQFMRTLEQELVSKEVLLGQAPTGLGKTVCGLNAFAKTGQRMAAIVPSIYIANQWREEAMMHLGLSDDQVGMVGDGTCDYEGKVFTAVVIHNLFSDRLPDEFYRSFGAVAFDECHRLGATSFSQSAGMFHARYRLALTANPNCRRKDQCEQVIFASFGTPWVVATAEAMEADCWVVNFTAKKAAHPKMATARQLGMLCVDTERNTLLSTLVKNQYAKGRQGVIFSDRVQHLMALRWEAINVMGIPEEDVGLFVGQEEREDGTRRKVKQSELDEVKRSAKIIFATYGMMKEAVDIPRLDFGIEATPKADNMQAVGRIRRKFEGKQKPRWIVVRDKRFPIFSRMTDSNLKLLQQSNINLNEYGDAKTLI